MEGDLIMADEDKAVNNIDAGKATSIVRQYLEENYGNLGMLLFRVISVSPNGAKDQFHVLSSLLSSIGSSKRLYYQIKVNISDGRIIEVFQGEEDKDNADIIQLRKVSIKQ